MSLDFLNRLHFIVKRSMCLSTEERAELFTTLNTMVPNQLNHLIFTLNPPPGSVPPAIAAQSDRVYALLSWAEAIGGCGLPQVQMYLATVLRDHISTVQQETHSSLSKSLIQAASNDEAITVWDISTKRWHSFPPGLLASFRKVSGRQKSLKLQYVRDWKRVHTLAEKLYPRYAKLHNCMSLCRKMTEIQRSNDADRYRDIATSHFEAFEPEVTAFADSLRELSIRQIAPIGVLRTLPICSSAINQSLGGLPNTPIFHNGILLTERISKILLDALHMADQVLELYFKELEVS
mgnify:CR=1 FL=1